MSEYSCEKCGMGVKGMTCAKCERKLEHAVITNADGTEVHVSQCPDGCGKIKSPMCCGQDMGCSA